ncbi:MAG: alpha-keto acid decarboxylase family protein [Thermodesulfobacteriota bacterium]
MEQTETTTVGQYLVRRLEQVGLKHIFGVPGDYVLRFFDLLEASNIDLVVTCNELNAGYAADAYARLNGVGGVCVTYGVGGFSVFNAVAGAFAERVPLIVVSGGPRITQGSSRVLLHHTIGEMNLQYKIFEHITAAAVVLQDPAQAPDQIDQTIAVCLRARRPVYIEIPMDMVAQPCRPAGSFEPDTTIPSDPEALTEAVAEAAQMLAAARNPAVLVGVEIHRLGLCQEMEQFISSTRYPFATTISGKSVLSERHPQFLGVYFGKLGPEAVKQSMEEADVLLCLGTLMTDVDLGIDTATHFHGAMIVANSDKVGIKHHIYPQVALGDFIRDLQAGLPPSRQEEMAPGHAALAGRLDFTPVPSHKITLKRFYQRLNRFLDKNNLIISDAGNATLFGASELFLPDEVPFIAQAFYVSIGYSLPATLGVKLAAPNLRPIAFIGDGAFQMTVQELSTIIRRGLNPIIFIMNNDGYAIERVFHDGPYNDLQMWRYSGLPEIFGGGWACEVRTEGELEDALNQALSRPKELVFIEVRLDRQDYWESLLKLKNLR